MLVVQKCSQFTTNVWTQLNFLETGFQLVYSILVRNWFKTWHVKIVYERVPYFISVPVKWFYMQYLMKGFVIWCWLMVATLHSYVLIYIWCGWLTILRKQILANSLDFYNIAQWRIFKTSSLHDFLQSHWLLHLGISESARTRKPFNITR